MSGMERGIYPEGLSDNLLLVAACVWLFGFWVSSRYLPYWVALVTTTIKILIPLVYFAWFFDGTWVLRDDIDYLNQSAELLTEGYDPLSAVLDPEGEEPLRAAARGSHVLYYWWNFTAMYFFGRHYYPTVFLNLGLTFVCSYVMFKLVRLSGFSQSYAQVLAVFCLLQADIVVWSSLLNLKDILVMTLTLLALYGIVQLSKQCTLWNLFLTGASVYLLFWIRFYVPLMLVPAAVLWFGLDFLASLRTMVAKTLLQKVALLVLMGSGALGVVAFIGLDKILAFQAASIRPSLYGMLRMVLTPQPWSVAVEYSFLELPSILHWAMLLPCGYSAWLLWRQSKDARLLLLYLLLALFFYGSYETQQGPRHRVQILFIIAWLQFHFLWFMAHEPLRKQILRQRAAVQGLLLPRLSWYALRDRFAATVQRSVEELALVYRMSLTGYNRLLKR